MAAARNSDRWITPAVICTALLVGGGVVASIVGGVAYLSARGVDPDPLLKLAATLVGAVGSVGTFVLQLAQRSQNSKTERNTGVLASVVDERLPAPPPPAPRHAQQSPAAYVVDLDDDPDDARTAVAVPAVPPLPESLRRRRTDAR